MLRTLFKHDSYEGQRLDKANYKQFHTMRFIYNMTFRVSGPHKLSYLASLLMLARRN